MHLIDFIRSMIDERHSTGNDDSFYIFDSGDVRLKYQKWIELIPRVVPFYAVKCNSDPFIVKCLAELGTGFDCASIYENKQILHMGIDPNRIIYANTVKQPSHLQYAADNGIDRVTFDCLAELDKIKKIHPNAKVVLRIKCDAESSLVNLGSKSGCDPIAASELIKRRKDLELNLIGFSFHVGSGTHNYDVYAEALRKVRQLFDVAERFEFKLNFVDIGGGFMGNDINLLSKYAIHINEAIEKYFPDPSVAFISEPGRYFADSAYTLVTKVISKRISADGHRNYYINESISQSFMMKYLVKEKIDFKIIRGTKMPGPIKEYLSTVWGQSCNGMDVILDNEVISEIEIGDHMVFENMGAYTRSLSSNFNGFNIGEVIELNSIDNAI